MITRDILLFGIPGSGKGTLASNITSGDTGFIHMSTGDIFRQNMKDETQLGLEIIEVMDTGELVNDELTIAIVEDFILPYLEKDSNKFIIFDGFPRTEPQLHWLINLFHDLERPLPLFFDLLLDKSGAKDRIKERAVKQNRSEDQNDQVIAQRFDVYDNETSVVKDLMPEYLPFDSIITIDASLTPKEVHKAFLQYGESAS